MRASRAGWYTLRIKLAKNGVQKEYGLAKLVYTTFSKKDVGKDEVIRYKDGDTYNCDIDNLYVISMSEELYKEFEDGRRKRAEFDYYGEKITIRDISKMTDMPISTAWSRLNTQKWNIYETVETPLAMNKKRKERLINGKS